MTTAIEPSTSDRLRLTEIFYSLQGEAASVGWPTVFVRLTGCPLRCGYCDTAYAFHGGTWWEIDAILAEVAKHGAKHVCVTGGEPLAQKRCIDLLKRLCDAGYEVSLETSGAIDIAAVDARVARVVDLKTPGSGEQSRNLWQNIALLTSRDQVKFVLCDRTDYNWALAMLREHDLPARCDVLFSPSYGQLQSRELAEWMLADHVPARFQLQLHKVLWGEEIGR
ncbi:MAG TPA: 7-carboxy-7-deazaguanine synthase QueE [Xanthomonadaceae bacterium]|nr:7-carboxy-7-deazaguanine synthase QueE [Xanthomonadaceae bacterium]